MIDIVIPMAGGGSRFVDAGFETPKPFVDVNGTPMIERILENLSIPESRFILIMQPGHLDDFGEYLDQLQGKYPIEIALVDGMTEGAACSVLHARALINHDRPLIIANSDQIVDIDVGLFVRDCLDRSLDGSILTFVDPERNPKWSFAQIDDAGIVTRVKEKEAISEYATVGMYFFLEGRAFVNATIDMIVHGDRVNGEFYVCPTYNHAIANGGRFGIYTIETSEMHGLGTPEDLAKYLADH